MSLADDLDDGGTLNPDEMSLNSSLAKAINGEVDMVICAQGYLMTKMGNHRDARKIFENCSDAGYTGTMTWMAYMEQNGFGADEDPEKAAAWDRLAADNGDPIGMFNYGLDLLRGYGVDPDPELGRQYIDQAADLDVKVAKELQAADYDVEVVTPDADSWKFQRIF